MEDKTISNKIDLSQPSRIKIKKAYLYIFIIAILIKLILIVFPGYPYDLSLHQKWGNFLINHSPLEIYNQTTCNLPPVWVYNLWFFSNAHHLITHQPISIISEVLKLPAVLADIAIGLIIFYFLIKKGVKEKIALVASLFFLLNPFVIYNSSVWGQLDSVYTLFALLAFILADQKKTYLGSIFLALSFLTKLQGIIFLPLFLFFIFNKYSRKIKFITIAFYLATIVITIFPFILAGNKLGFLVEKTWITSSKILPYLSANAFNLWWPLQIIISPLKIFYLSENINFVGPLTFKIAGFILFALFYLLIFLKRKSNVFFLASLISLLFFMIPTAMHERYIFPFFAFLPIVGAMAWPKNKKYLWIYIIFSLTSLLNLFFAFSINNIFFLNLFWTLSIFLSLINIFFFFYLFYDLLRNKKIFFNL